MKCKRESEQLVFFITNQWNTGQYTKWNYTANGNYNWKLSSSNGDFDQRRNSYEIGPAVDSPLISEAWPTVAQNKDQLENVWNGTVSPSKAGEVDTRKEPQRGRLQGGMMVGVILPLR